MGFSKALIFSHKFKSVSISSSKQSNYSTAINPTAINSININQSNHTSILNNCLNFINNEKCFLLLLGIFILIIIQTIKKYL